MIMIVSGQLHNVLC